jgi:hypothetical protein
MSQENVEIVRKPLRVRERSSRTLDQRLSLRFPRLAAANSRLIAKLPPTSRLRQAALSRAARLGLEAYNRRDLPRIRGDLGRGLGRRQLLEAGGAHRPRRTVRDPHAGAAARQGERCPTHRDACACHDNQGRQGDPPGGVLGPGGGPRSRGPQGVGDVAGERGGRALEGRELTLDITGSRTDLCAALRG